MPWERDVFMFFVINKEKIYAYAVSILTIVILFFMSSVMNSDINKTEQVSSNSTKVVDNIQNKNENNNNNSNSDSNTAGTISEIVPND